MPRDTLTSSPWPGWSPAGPTDAGPCSRTGSTAPPWAPTPGTRNARPGASARIRASSSGAVAPTTRPTVPPGPQPVASRATRSWSRSAGRVGGRVRGDHEVLELARPGIGRPAQDVREPVGALEQR